MKTAALNILCVSRYFKGEDFFRGLKDTEHKVYLLTSEKLKEEDWPWDAIEDSFFMPENEEGRWNMDHVLNGLAHIMRNLSFDLLVALDDYDVDKVAHIREHFRIPGMGETTSRHFRDKLAMRIQAQDAKIPVPTFTDLFNDERIHRYADLVPAPYLIKPRSAASAEGIVKIKNREELWNEINKLGENRHGYLLEHFAPGDVFHVDGLVFNNKILFTRVSQYLDTPLTVSQGGGIFRSQTASFNSKDDKILQDLNAKVIKAFGLKHGAFHSEYIKGQDGNYYFLETSSRVGGAHLAEMVEASSGINLWSEWGKIEVAAATKTKYKLPKVLKKHAGIVVSLSRFEKPDMSSFDDKEVWWKINKEWHVGMIVCSSKRGRISELLDDYGDRIAKDFHASAPTPDTHYNP